MDKEGIDDGRSPPPRLVLSEGDYVQGIGLVAYGKCEIVGASLDWTREELAEWAKRRRFQRRKEATNRKKQFDNAP